MRFTKTGIDALTCPQEKRDTLFADSDTKGFLVRVTASGSKVFLYQYRFAGQVRRLRLGAYGALTVAQARRMAEEARGRVLSGGDPVGERREVVAAFKARQTQQVADAIADELTFDKLVDRWLGGALRDRSDNYRREAPRRLRHGFPALLARPAHQITLADVQARLDEIAEVHPTTARRLHAYGRAMFTWAAKRNLVPGNPFMPAVVEGRDVSRERILSDAELGAYWRASANLGYPFGPFLRLLALTLQRRTELAGMHWEELAPDLSTWTVPASRAKNGRAHIVHLSDTARHEFSAIPRRTLPDGTLSPLVFTNTGTSSISGFSDAKERLERFIETEHAIGSDVPKQPGRELSLPVSGWTLHDLRRTGVTAMARLGIGPHIADMTLNHVQGTIRGVAAVYQRHQFLRERAIALDAWAAHIVACASEVRPSNVLPFRK